MGSYPFDTKIAVVLREDLAPWQRVNAASYLIGAITHAFPQLVGAGYEDADGTPYLATLGQPLFVFEGGKETLAEIRERAVRRELALSVFTHDLFGTGNDEDNRAAVRAVRGADLDLVGVAVHGASNAVDRVMKGARRHP
ncbi:DUF2000 domain-containing protein [Nocardioides sp. BP30]|uniref:DUF2000 domain-containing protein n=1 Tax=Nocardioides sp. BP30 TaxID=3036374 RepID=UPI0024683A28|nr:DUF2000 domain-containing protein [Nocardioides sp. BP30]WGL51375.1 DUF2000 domain-containing protein [Nocardioides sp. BP30]